MAPPKKKAPLLVTPGGYTISSTPLPRLSKNGRRIKRPFTQRAWRLFNRGRTELVLKYLENDGELPEVDVLVSMKTGTLVRLTSPINARGTRPMKRSQLKSINYRSKVLVYLAEDTRLMFLKRHSKFPEWSKYCVVGGRVVWINSAEWFDCILEMRPSSKKKTSQVDS